MKKFSLVFVIVASLIAILLRLSGQSFLNFSAMGGLAVLCGAVIRPSWLGLLIPLGCRLITDCVLEYRTGYGFYDSMAFEYGAYAAIFGIARLVRPTQLPAAFGTGLLAALTFFVISNLGVWMMPHEGQYLYAHTLAGLIQCFTMALPFAKGTLAGDVGFSIAFICSWHYLAAGVQTEVEEFKNFPRSSDAV